MTYFQLLFLPECGKSLFLDPGLGVAYTPKPKLQTEVGPGASKRGGTGII